MAGSKNWTSEAHLDQFLRRHSARDDRLCVALSGGRDSALLLHAASCLNPPLRLCALHVHHNLSPHADEWADFCAKFCSARGVPLTVVRVRVDGDSSHGLEAAARQARYEAFAACGADSLLLAHHQGDQAETVLFNLLRGSGVAGAAGMPAERPWRGLRLLRPWLAVPSGCIAVAARQAGIDWVEDASNADRAFSRNFLRHDIMPVLEGRFPAASARLAGAAANFAEAGRLLAELAAADWESGSEGDALPLATIRALSRERLKNLLRWRLHGLGWRVPGSERLDEFVRQLQSAAPDRHPALELPDGEMRVAQRRLRWICNRKQAVPPQTDAFG